MYIYIMDTYPISFMFNECKYLKNYLDREDIHAEVEWSEIYDKVL